MPYGPPTVGYWDRAGYTWCPVCASDRDSTELLDSIKGDNWDVEDVACDGCSTLILPNGLIRTSGYVSLVQGAGRWVDPNDILENERQPITTEDDTLARLTDLGRQLAELARQRDLLWDQIRSTAVPALMRREVTLAAVSAAVGFTRKSVTEQLRRHPDYRTRPRAR